MKEVKEREPILVLVFNFITCGIYYIYYQMATQDELNPVADDGYKTSGLAVVLLSIVTFGIYYIYWLYKTTKRADAITNRNMFLPTTLLWIIANSIAIVLSSMVAKRYIDYGVDYVIDITSEPLLIVLALVANLIYISFMYIFLDNVCRAARIVNTNLK